MMKKRYTFLIIAGVSLLVALAWEYLFYWNAFKDPGLAFQRRLHKQEQKIDKQLVALSDREVSFTSPWDEDESIILLIFNNENLQYWSQKRIGVPDLYSRLKSSGGFIKLNNVYYDVRYLKKQSLEYFALIMVRSDHSEDGGYLKNSFNPVFDISLENTDKVTIHDKADPRGFLVCNSEGTPLFRIDNQITENDIQPSYFILLFYLLFYYAILQIYERFLSRTRSFREQLWCIFVFAIFLVILRVLMVVYHLPSTLYNTAIFEAPLRTRFIEMSVGDLFVSMFFFVTDLFITLHGAHFRQGVFRNPRSRYFYIIIFVFLVFIYADLLHFMINSLIENASISMNMTMIFNVSFVSLFMFITIILFAVGLIVLMGFAVRYFRLFFSARRIFTGVTIVSILCATICYVLHLSLTPLECLFLFSLFLLFIFRDYYIRPDLRKNVLIASLVAMSIYIIFLAKSAEMQRENGIRSDYAATVVEERLPVFEYELKRLDRFMKSDHYLESLVFTRDEEAVSRYVTMHIFDLFDFYFNTRITICEAKDTLSGDPRYDHFLRSECERVGHSNFYHVQRFDGLTSYVGRFFYTPSSGTPLCLYINFSSRKGYNDIGYSRILLHSDDGEKFVYPYSYGKYLNGHLIASQGTYDYPEHLSRFEMHGHVNITKMNGYSHMIIPVGGNGAIVVSLVDEVFKLYYVNIFYFLFVCIFLLLLGRFLGDEPEERLFIHKSLRRDIKYGIIFLVCTLVLLVISVSTVFTSLGLTHRYNVRMLDFTRVISSQLLGNNDLNPTDLDDFTRVVYDLSSDFAVDVNIYDEEGKILVTSRNSAFTRGFEGMLLHPEAYRRILCGDEISFIQEESIGDIPYAAAYMLLEMKNGDKYIMNIPYFRQTSEQHSDVALIVLVAANIAVIAFVVAFILSEIVAERSTRSLRMLYGGMRQVRADGLNFKVDYLRLDEVGLLVKVYNSIVDRYNFSVDKLSRLEGNNTWFNMARQVAHDVKNPLTPMRLHLQYLLQAIQREDSDKLRQHVSDVSSMLITQIDHISSVASLFSDLAKMQKPNNTLFDMSQLVEEGVSLFSENVPRLSTDIMPDMHVFGDREQIHRVVVNILKNAVQSIPPDREGHLHVALQPHAGLVVLSIQDNGVGIPDELYHSIGKLNFTTKSEGSGLGLAMSYSIVENMGGSIRFESREGEGTTFYVTFKLGPSE